MGRAWRIEYEGALYHILSRGNEQKDIFYDKDKGHYFILGVQAHLYKKLVKMGNQLLSQVRFLGRAAKLAPTKIHSMISIIGCDMLYNSILRFKSHLHIML